MADLEPPLYIFDDYALEQMLARGSDETHARVAHWANGTLCVTSSVKTEFLAAYPEDELLMGSFKVVRKCEVDNRITGTLVDNLQNLPDIDSREVRAKVFLLAMASRLDATVVTAEQIGPTTWIKSLADTLNIKCITAQDFLEAA